MSSIDLVKGVGGLLFTGTFITAIIFGNFILNKDSATMWGVPIRAEYVHMILGPVLILINSVIVVFLWALVAMEIDHSTLAEIQKHQVFKVLGPILNPFYHGSNGFVNSIGYMFLITLWWFGMHTFGYSIDKNPSQPLLFGWKVLFSFLFLAAGLASMLAIQFCWSSWGMDTYKWKLRIGFIGIAIGGFGIPLLFRLGIPSILQNWKS